MKGKTLIILSSLLLTITNISHAFSNTSLTKQIDDYVAGIRNENIKHIAQHYDDSIQLMIQANPSIIGRVNAEKYFSELFKEFEIDSYTRNVSEVLDMESQKAEIGTYQLRMRNSHGETRELNGSYLSLWKIFENSDARLVADVWNFDLAIDFAKELSFASVPSTVTALEPHLPISSPTTFELAAYSALIDESVPLRDPTVMSLFYTKNASILANSRPPISGLENIKAYWNTHIEEIAGLERLQGRTTKVDDLGKYIIQYSAHIAMWRSGEYSGVSTGKHLRIWERQSDGRIKTRILASAYDT